MNISVLLIQQQCCFEGHIVERRSDALPPGRQGSGLPRRLPLQGAVAGKLGRCRWPRRSILKSPAQTVRMVGPSAMFFLLVARGWGVVVDLNQRICSHREVDRFGGDKV